MKLLKDNRKLPTFLMVYTKWLNRTDHEQHIYKSMNTDQIDLHKTECNWILEKLVNIIFKIYLLSFEKSCHRKIKDAS